MSEPLIFGILREQLLGRRFQSLQLGFEVTKLVVEMQSEFLLEDVRKISPGDALLEVDNCLAVGLANGVDQRLLEVGSLR